MRLRWEMGTDVAIEVGSNGKFRPVLSRVPVEFGSPVEAPG